MSTIDSSINDCLRRMRRLATAIEASTEEAVGAELWMKLEHIQLGNLLTHRASYNTRPDINWSWITLPTT